jgi:carbon-monoxide dehydrogenase medium subunit
MIPRKFEYFAPSTVNEAIALLKKYDPDAKVLAGGMSLIPVMKLRLGSPAYVVDINRIPGLDQIKVSGNRLLIGPLTRHHSFESSDVVRSKVPLLAETAAWIGDPQVRNMGTVGGSLAHSDPSGDWGATMLALRADVTVQGPTQQRTIPIDDFLVDTFTSALQPDELLTEIAINLPPSGSGGAYMKLERKSGDFATVGIAAQISIDQNGVCTYAGIGMTAVGNKNLRARKAEETLLGKSLTPEVLQEAAQAAAEDSSPSDDPLRGSAEYKKEMVGVFTRRGLSMALTRAKGSKT